MGSSWSSYSTNEQRFTKTMKPRTSPAVNSSDDFALVSDSSMELHNREQEVEIF